MGGEEIRKRKKLLKNILLKLKKPKKKNKFQEFCYDIKLNRYKEHKKI